MDEVTDEYNTKSTISDCNEYNLSPVGSSVNELSRKDDDYRIACSNSRSLDLITQIVSSNVSKFAKSLHLGQEQSHLTSRVLEIFKDTLQENVTVNGLPYVCDQKLLAPSDKNFLSPPDSEVLTNEAKEALLSNLSKKVQEVCVKRRHYPQEYTKIHKMRLHHEYQSVKKASVTHKVSLPLVSKEAFNLDSLSSERFQETSEQVKSAQNKLLDTVNELKVMQNNIKYAQKVADKQESLCDTGYISS